MQSPNLRGQATLSLIRSMFPNPASQAVVRWPGLLDFLPQANATCIRRFNCRQNETHKFYNSFTYVYIILYIYIYIIFYYMNLNLKRVCPCIFPTSIIARYLEFTISFGKAAATTLGNTYRLEGLSLKLALQTSPWGPRSLEPLNCCSKMIKD